MAFDTLIDITIERDGTYMRLFQYETHLHTTEASACGRYSAKEHVEYYKEAGFAGIVVTDHFFNGNSNIPKNLPWEERVDLFCLGYENAKAEGDKVGLSVFFGWEANYKGTEFLIYGLNKTWLKKNPDILSWTIEEQYKRVHKDGGYVIHAHPFRERSYIPEIRLFPQAVDAVEGWNARNYSDEADRRAMEYAKKYKLAISAGTDAHGQDDYHSGVAFEHRLNDIHDLINQLKEGRQELLPIK